MQGPLIDQVVKQFIEREFGKKLTEIDIRDGFFERGVGFWGLNPRNGW